MFTPIAFALHQPGPAQAQQVMTQPGSMPHPHGRRQFGNPAPRSCEKQEHIDPGPILENRLKILGGGPNRFGLISPTHGITPNMGAGRTHRRNGLAGEERRAPAVLPPDFIPAERPRGSVGAAYK